jgi:hypothetical protein
MVILVYIFGIWLRYMLGTCRDIYLMMLVYLNEIIVYV